MEGPFIVAIVAIIFGIVYAGYEKWLEHRAEGAGSAELEAAVETLAQRLSESEKKRKALEGRIQNLETIVTSEDWELLTGELRDANLSLPEGAKHEDDSARAERLARRLRQ